MKWILVLCDDSTSRRNQAQTSIPRETRFQHMQYPAKRQFSNLVAGIRIYLPPTIPLPQLCVGLSSPSPCALQTLDLERWRTLSAARRSSPRPSLKLEGRRLMTTRACRHRLLTLAMAPLLPSTTGMSKPLFLDAGAVWAYTNNQSAMLTRLLDTTFGLRSDD